MLAMLAVDEDEELNHLGFDLRLQVHDELVGVCPIRNADGAAARLAQVMAGAMPPEEFGNVPLPVDAHVGMTWAEAKEGKQFA